MATTKPLLTFYGATAGCTLAALAPALTAGYDCTALARTPSKLTSLLLEKGVPQPALDAHLTITKGDVLNPDDVKAPLTHPSSGRPATIVVSGIGLPPSLDTLPTRPQITLCATAAANILRALRAGADQQQQKKPLFIALSTTGVSAGPRDVPLLFAPFYHLLLANPHRDKRDMEEVIVGLTDRFVIVRPSLLVGGAGRGGGGVRVGREDCPAVGYWICRDDVGGWVFENLLRGDADEGGFVGVRVSLTY